MQELSEDKGLDGVDLLILALLNSNGATDNISSITIAELMQCEEIFITYNTLYKHIASLCFSKYVEKGVSYGHASSYFICEKGMDLLKECRTKKKKEIKSLAEED